MYIIRTAFTYRLTLAVAILTTATAIASAEESTYSSILTRTYIGDGTQYVETIDFYDGLGNIRQHIDINATPTGKDLVTLYTYDNAARPTQTTLPTPVENNNGNYNDNIISQAAVFYNTEHPYTEKTYTNPTFPAAPRYANGEKLPAQYHEHPTAIQHILTSCEHLTINNQTNTLVKMPDYPTASIRCVVETDQDGNQTRTFYDGLNRVVATQKGTLSRTLFVYDQAGRLACVLPPMATAQLNSISTIDLEDNNSLLALYGYTYIYDNKGNVIRKRLPGCGWIRYVYDKAARLCLTQTPQIEKDYLWVTQTYDCFDRPGTSSIVRFNNAAHLQLIQSFAARLATEQRSDLHYTNMTFSNADLVRYLSEYFYDDHSFIPDSLNALRCDLTHATARHKTNRHTGLLTGHRTYTLADDNTSVLTAFYYDSVGNILQQRANNLIGGYDHTYTLYNIQREPVTIEKRHTNSIASTIDSVAQTYYYTYDTQGRLDKIRYHINNTEPTYTLAQYYYDELGRTIAKKRINNIETDSFYYNILSQPTRIKYADFEENIYYQNGPTGIACDDLYNGNICATTWKHCNDNTKGYAYFYDDNNRLTNARAIIGGQEQNAYEATYQYDLNGNATTIVRADKNANVIDNISLTYHGNKLMTATDAAGSRNSYNITEFHDLEQSNDERAYDSNGNLTKDLDRDIDTIGYNHLNLPQKVHFRSGNWIINRYTADGTKYRTTFLTRKASAVEPITNIEPDDNDNNYHRTDVYYDGDIRMDNFNTWVDNGECYTKFYGKYGENYKFFYRYDHLGSVREMWVYPWADYTERLQNIDYYPDGMPWGAIGTADMPHAYNKKEWNNTYDLQEYDSKARQYYPALMRTTTQDPLAEQYYDTSPYAWCANNPVRVVDPTGEDTLNVIFNNETKLWELSDVIIIEGNDVINVIDTDGNMMTYEFSEGRYGYRICSIRIENDNYQTLGVFLLSGDGYAAYTVEPPGLYSNSQKGTPIECGEYNITISNGDKWYGYPCQSNARLSQSRATLFHYAWSLKNNNSQSNLTAVKWTTKCAVVSSSYTKSNGYVKYNGYESKNTLLRLAQYCGAKSFIKRTGRYDNCSWNELKPIIRIIK